MNFEHKKTTPFQTRKIKKLDKEEWLSEDLIVSDISNLRLSEYNTKSNLRIVER